MLTIIRPGTVTLERAAYMPQFLRSLAEAARQGTALAVIRSKLSAVNRQEAIVKAMASGLIHP